MYKSKIVLALVSVVLLSAAATLLSANQKSKYQTVKAVHMRNPIDSGEFFIGYKLCAGCHGYDSLFIGNITADSQDVNVFDDWRSTMMALSARDPLWQAKVHHEILVNPAHSNELQTTCTACHAPMGHFTAMFHGASHYTLDDVFQDTLAIEGVSCTGCHTIGTQGLGSRFSGDIPYDTTKKIFGPFTLPFTGPMDLYVGMTPTYSIHMEDSKVCSPCHTLLTHAVDLGGNFTGGTFVEQATYHEWLNSVFPSQGKVCQTCHMPQLEEPIVIANGILALQSRSPFNQHQFPGANEFMLKLIKANKTLMGITTADAYFDSSILYNHQLLTNSTLNINIQNDSADTDTSYFSVTLTNKAGHKFPSGYPSRRAVVQFVVLKENGDTLFKSGTLDGNYEVNNISSPYEIHHNIIKSQTQTQIYEMVMGDVNGNKTTVLERAVSQLKDNRIPPQGFNTAHYTYDTAKIVGLFNDPDFNLTGATQGNGKDIVHYHVAANGYTGKVNVFATVLYQTVPPGWLTEMFSFNDSLINSFKQMYLSADKNPVTVALDSLKDFQLPNKTNELFSSNSIFIYPSPATDGIIYITNKNISDIEIYNAEGKLLKSFKNNSASEIISIQIPDEQQGIYLIRLKVADSFKTYKVLRL